jgi:hypothetical protein
MLKKHPVILDQSFFYVNQEINQKTIKNNIVYTSKQFVNKYV